jgi:hypothetical protein
VFEYYLFGMDGNWRDVFVGLVVVIGLLDLFVCVLDAKQACF